MDARLAWWATRSRWPRQQALAEVAAGRKRGHWIWWAFPTLAARGGDINSALVGADLADAAEACALVRHPELRAGLLAVFANASVAFAAAAAEVGGAGPFEVLDSGFYGRQRKGAWRFDQLRGKERGAVARSDQNPVFRLLGCITTLRCTRNFDAADGGRKTEAASFLFLGASRGASL